jgi:hypothetical protein
MKKLLALLLLLPSLAFAQAGPPTWTLQGSSIVPFQNTMGVTLPSTVTGGSKGAGTINAAGLYINGVAVPTTAGSVASLSFGATGLTPSTATTGAITVAGVLNGANGGTGVANTGKTITLGGNFTTSGAYSLTATLTGATSVTFPTSGTLATTSQLGAYLPLAGGTMTGNLLFTDATYDIGASGATRPRSIYLSSTAIAPNHQISGTTSTSLLTSGVFYVDTVPMITVNARKMMAWDNTLGTAIGMGTSGSGTNSPYLYFTSTVGGTADFSLVGTTGTSMSLQERTGGVNVWTAIKGTGAFQVPVSLAVGGCTISTLTACIGSKTNIDSSGRLLVGTSSYTRTASEYFEVYGGTSLMSLSSASDVPLVIQNRDTTAATYQPYLTFADNTGNRGGISFRNDDSTFNVFAQFGYNFFAGASTYSYKQVGIAAVANAVNYLTLSGAIASSPPSIAIGGSDTNISLNLTPKGTGAVQIANSGQAAGTALKVTGSLQMVNITNGSDTFQMRNAANSVISQIYVDATDLHLDTASGSAIILRPGGTAAVRPYTTNNTDLGASSFTWRDLYVARNPYFTGLTTTPGSKQPLCIDTGTGQIYKGSGGVC